ncbi:hypothetical protein CCACVL1_09982 [Corchorus capsularis]|uniref:Fibronectin type III-like domain-containing protein n=1 Tax=Corchorus capsularis TaxID=210143 RepID=A0A1R3ITH3_COCAP|nr:hypothetical protein CCACVL1_09982 [Corchorus capsularis]
MTSDSVRYKLVSELGVEACEQRKFTVSVGVKNHGEIAVSEMGKELCDERKFPITVGVQNHGEMAGKHPVLLFVRQSKAGEGRPMKQLVGFQSVNLNAGERAEIEFELSPCEHLSRANEDGLMVTYQTTKGTM